MDVKKIYTASTIPTILGVGFNSKKLSTLYIYTPTTTMVVVYLRSMYIFLFYKEN